MTLLCSKLRNKFFLALLIAKISSLSNFQEICLYFFDGKSLFYAMRLSWEFMKKTTSKKYFGIHLSKEYEVENFLE